MSASMSRSFVSFRISKKRYPVLMTAGSFGLKEFASLRYKFRKSQMISPEEAAALGIAMKKPGEVTLEGEYEKIKDLDIDNWENKRGPRPWEENLSK